MKEELASQELLDYVFHDVLPRQVLPEFGAKSNVKQVRRYVNGVCATLGWNRAFPPASQDIPLDGISGMTSCSSMFDVEIQERSMASARKDN